MYSAMERWLEVSNTKVLAIACSVTVLVVARILSDAQRHQVVHLVDKWASEFTASSSSGSLAGSTSSWHCCDDN